MIEPKQGCDRPDSSGGNDNGSNSNDNSSGFYRDLIDRLQNLSFPSFQSLILLWLSAKGYRDICVLKRTGVRGRRPVGGADFVARAPHDYAVRVAVQIRRWKTPIQPRVVDELWGFMLREGIPLGLVISTGNFYPRTVKTAQEFPGRPIRLVSIAQLAGSMASLELGTEPAIGGQRISDRFFRVLNGLRFASSLAVDSLSRATPSSARLPNPAPSNSVESSSWHRRARRAAWALTAILVAFLLLWMTGGSR